MTTTARRYDLLAERLRAAYALMDANADAGDPLAEYHNPGPPEPEAVRMVPLRINSAPMLGWIGVCVTGIWAWGLVWVASAVLAWFARTVPAWVLQAIDVTIFIAGCAVALALLTPRK